MRYLPTCHPVAAERVAFFDIQIEELEMRFHKFLRLARQLSNSADIPDKPHIVVAVAFTGKVARAMRLNSEAECAEARVMRMVPDADRLVVYRFNRADKDRAPRASAPCCICCDAIKKSVVKKVEFMSRLGVATVGVSILNPYNKRHVKPRKKVEKWPAIGR